MKPIVDRLASEFRGKVDVYIVDVETQKYVDLIAAYRVNAIPTFAFVNSDGALNDYFVGGMSEEDLNIRFDALK